jgi:3-hydroxyacyl-CoA dehydrogenase
MSKSITVVGAGLVGPGWAIVAARAGHRVWIFDVTAEKIADALGVIEKNLADLASHGLVSNPDEIRAPWTSPDTTEGARSFMVSVQQVPIVLRREVAGFIVNLLQVALLSEAFRLVEDNVKKKSCRASCE